MSKDSKRFQEAKKAVEPGRLYSPIEAASLLKSVTTANFDETVEVHIKLGVNPRHADQQVRGTVMLPHGTGKTVRVAVFAKGEKATVIGTVVGALDLGSTTWYQWWDGNRYLYTHKTNVTALVAPATTEVAPDTTPYDQAALDAAVAAQKTADAAAMAAHLATDAAALTTATAAGVAKEKGRLRTLLGL